MVDAINLFIINLVQQRMIIQSNQNDSPSQSYFFSLIPLSGHAGSYSLAYLQILMFCNSLNIKLTLKGTLCKVPLQKSIIFSPLFSSTYPFHSSNVSSARAMNLLASTLVRTQLIPNHLAVITLYPYEYSQKHISQSPLMIYLLDMEYDLPSINNV